MTQYCTKNLEYKFDKLFFITEMRGAITLCEVRKIYGVSIIK